MYLKIPAIESKETRRFAQLSEKQTNSENKVQMEPNAKKSPTDDKIPNIAAMDNGTMVETFKFLNYFQLATRSLVSKKFWNLIRTHRHKLALLYNIYVANQGLVVIRMFNKELSPEKYNELIVRNGYSKQIPLEGQIDEKESTRNDRDHYEFRADVYQNPSHHIATTAFYARAELKDETWPLFQHFIRLLMDPFIYICTLSLSPQKDVICLLAGAMNQDPNRLQCKQLITDFNGDTQKFIAWIAVHVRCDEFEIYSDCDSNYDQELFDVFLTEAPCTSAILVRNYDLSKVIIDFVEKFMDLKNGDQNQMVDSIQGEIADRMIKVLKRKCNKFIVKKREDDDFDTVHVFEFTNNDIGKKLQFTIKSTDIVDDEGLGLDYEFVLTTNNL